MTATRQCTDACRRATSRDCACPCGGVNHGTVSPHLAALIEDRRRRDGQELYANGSGAAVSLADFLDGVNDALRISAEREGRAIPGRLL